MKKIIFFSLLIILFSSFVSAAYTDDAIAFYPMTSDCTTNTLGSDGTNNGATFVSSSDGCDFETDDSDYIDISNIVDSSLNTGGYISLWVTMESYVPYGAVIGLGDSPNSDFVSIGDKANNYLNARVYNPTENIVSDSSDVSSGFSTYKHVAMNWNSNGHITNFWVGGTDKGSSTGNTVSISFVDGFIGAHPWASATANYWDGKIIGVIIGSGALTQTDVNNLNSEGRTYNPFSGMPTNSQFKLYAKTNLSETVLTEFSAILYNETTTLTQSTTNGTIYFDIKTGNYNLNVSSLGYAIFNTTLNDIDNNATYTASLYENNSISVNIYDGKTFELINFTEISYTVFGNNTDFYLEGSTSNGSLFLTDLDADIYLFELFKDDLYPQQEYFVTLQDNEYKELNTYLINNTYISTTLITLVDPYDVKIEGATVTIQELISGSYVTISQKITDTTGQARFYLKDDETYKAIIELEGYETREATITPITNPYEVTLRIDPEITYSYTTPMTGISYLIDPENTFITNSEQWFNLTVLSSSGSLSWFAVKRNGELSNITTSPSGGTTGILLNLSNINDAFNIEYSFKVSGLDTFFKNVTYIYSNSTPSNSSIYSGVISVEDDFSIFQKLLIIIVSCVFLILIAFELGLPSEVYGFLVTGVTIFFALPAINWIPVSIPIVIGLLSGFGAYTSSRGGFNG